MSRLQKFLLVLVPPVVVELGLFLALWPVPVQEDPYVGICIISPDYVRLENFYLEGTLVLRGVSKMNIRNCFIRADKVPSAIWFQEGTNSKPKPATITSKWNNPTVTVTAP